MSNCCSSFMEDVLEEMCELVSDLIVFVKNIRISTSKSECERAIKAYLKRRMRLKM